MENNNDINLGIEVDISSPENFLLIKESLTRMGIPSRKDKTLYQSAHILHKRGKYYIMHFKELFVLDGRENNISEEDIQRRNLIAGLLQDWGLLKVKNVTVLENKAPLHKIRVLSYRDKEEWDLSPKYKIGTRH